MKQKAVQDFANVCCQMFLSSLSNSDRLNFVIFGSGIVTMDFLSLLCTHNKLSISPLFYCISFREWLNRQCLAHNSDLSAIEVANLQVDMTVECYRNTSGGIRGWLSTRMDFKCSSHLAFNGRAFKSEESARQERGLGQILHGHQY